MKAKEFLSSLFYLKGLSNSLRVDRFKYVCAAEGISERKAMDMFHHLMILIKGDIPYVENKKPTPEYIESLLDMASRASAEYAHGMHLKADLSNFGFKHWGDEFGYALYIFTKDGEEKKAEEMDIASPDTYISVSLMLKGGWKIKGVIRQCDMIYDTRGCLDLTKEQRLTNKSLRVYDGDVFEVIPSDSILSSPANCGMYLCNNGAYRKLLYVPGKGYVNHGEVIVDGDTLEIEIDQKGLFNSHKITWGGFRKVGNIHVDMGCLIEKK